MRVEYESGERGVKRTSRVTIQSRFREKGVGESPDVVGVGA